MKILFHGAGSANLGGATLIKEEGGMDPANVIVTNSNGVIWKSADGSTGSFKNDEQKSVAQIGKPEYPQDLVSIVREVKPDAIIAAVGRVPNCFTKDVIKEMVAVQDAKSSPMRP